MNAIPNGGTAGGNIDQNTLGCGTLPGTEIDEYREWMRSVTNSVCPGRMAPCPCGSDLNQWQQWEASASSGVEVIGYIGLQPAALKLWKRHSTRQVLMSDFDSIWVLRFGLGLGLSPSVERTTRNVA